MKLLKKIYRRESGQAFIMVLILLLVGMLIIAPLLALMSTGLIAGQMYEEKMNGLYAADAGVEDALWKIMNLAEVPVGDEYYLTVNEMPVSIVIEEVTTFYVLEVGEPSPSGHNVNFELASEYLGWANGIHSYKLWLTNKTGSPVNILSIIISYSADPGYLSGLTDEAIEGLKSGSFELFDQEFTYLDSTTILTWDFTSPRPEIKAAPDPDNEDYTTVTCTFELAGPEDAAGITVLLMARRNDIGTVWEFKPFKIIATAQAEDGSTVVVEAIVLESSDAVLVSSWEIDPPG